MNKKIIVLTLSLFFLFPLTGCIQQVKYNLKKAQSDILGLNREVTIYSLDAKPIRTIKGKFKILYPTSNRMEFIKEDGRKITVTGYYSAIIEEN